jgi:hypothetical protein
MRNGDVEMRFLRTVVGYKMTGYKRNENIKYKLGIMDMNTLTKDCQNKWPEHLEKVTRTHSILVNVIHQESNTRY